MYTTKSIKVHYILLIKQLIKINKIALLFNFAVYEVWTILPVDTFFGGGENQFPRL